MPCIVGWLTGGTKWEGRAVLGAARSATVLTSESTGEDGSRGSMEFFRGWLSHPASSGIKSEDRDAGFFGAAASLSIEGWGRAPRPVMVGGWARVTARPGSAAAVGRAETAGAVGVPATAMTFGFGGRPAGVAGT